MNRKYNLKLDLQFRCNNSTMKFDEFDNNTSDFFIRVTRAGELIDISKAIVTLVVIKPDNSVDAQFVDIDSNRAYCDLKPTMKNLVGKYEAIASITVDGETVNTGIDNPIIYEVTENKFLRQLNQKVVTEERFTLLTDMINRLSTIEISEEQRVINEAERILSEENRKIEEAKRVEAELIRQHEEADRAKYDATRESNENIRKQNESIRLANEANRIDEETKRVEEENKRKLAEEERNANYNFMTEDEERRRLEANAHKEAEVLRVQAETNRVNEEAKRRTTEQARVSAENTRVGNENTRKANETTRQTNETQRVEAETQRQNRYNSFIADAEANANNFENYTNTAKVKEEERKSNELDRKSQEARRVSNEVERISNENTRKANEKAREKNETSRQYVFENKVDEVDKKIIEINATKDNFVSSVNTKVDSKISELDNTKSDMATSINNKVNEVENRFNALTSKQQQDAEVIDARDGETSLKTRLDRDIEKAKQVYVNIEGSHISTDSSVGYAKGVEILGNTIQSASNLADIRSVGDKVEGQELYEIPVLSCGKNVCKDRFLEDMKHSTNRYFCNNGGYATPNGIIYLNKGSYIMAIENTDMQQISLDANIYIWKKDKNFSSCRTSKISSSFTINDDEVGITFYASVSSSSVLNDYVGRKIQIEEGTVATPYEPYVEDKLTILSPTPLEKDGDVADRIIEKNGVWGVEKNVVDKIFNGNEDWVLSGWAPQENTIAFKLQNTKNNNLGICDKFTLNRNNTTIDIEAFNVSSEWNEISIRVNKSKLSTQDVVGFKKWLSDNNVLVMYSDNTSTFIPLPHDQQVKLRTFANKTNISFSCEIEGTIKAQVPKSLGATVNTHTEQINNLNKELDRVKKLEESTVSTVETESDFTTVEATSNGYFEDVKLEGKTLVNLFRFKDYKIINEVNLYAVCSDTKDNNITSNRTFTFRNTTSRQLTLDISENGTWKRSVLLKANEQAMVTTTPTEYVSYIYGAGSSGWEVNSESHKQELKNACILLEGDHTQNPPSYFEGLKSVGQSATTSEDGVDEIVVSSVKGDGNLVIDANINLYIPQNNAKVEKTTEGIRAYNRITGDDRVFLQPFRVKQGSKVTISFDVKVDTEGSSTLFYLSFLDANFNTIINTNFPTKIYKTSFERLTKTFNVGNASYIRIELVSFGASAGATYKNIMVSNHSKPYVPYQSDKKRLLYYNTETQAWEKPTLREWDSIEKHANGKYYYHVRSIEEDYVEGDEIVTDYITDMTTTVKPLSQEKIYECTNIDLITYANETNFIVESGVLSPRTTLKVHNNISNVVSLLQKKVSLLESNVKASQEVQDMMILETDMRMLDIELALMEFIPMTLNLGGSNMLRSATYFNFLKNHIINETYEKEYLENVMNKYLATGRINQDEYNELYKMLYPPVYDIELPIEY